MSTRSRLSPEERREQLLDLGVRLLATRTLDELSIDVLAGEAGVSRGLLYHYFGDKLAFREAVVRRAATAMVEATAPPETGEPLDRLAHALAAYVDWVDANHEAYVSLIRGAASDPTLREVYEYARNAITDRILTEADATELVPQTEPVRLLVRGWQAMTEEMVLAWKAGESTVTRHELLDLLTSSLPALAMAAPSGETS